MNVFQFFITCKQDKQRNQRPSLCEARKEKTREFQTQLLHYFSKGDNKSNHYHLGALQGRPGKVKFVLDVLEWGTLHHHLYWDSLLGSVQLIRCSRHIQSSD